MIELPQTAVDRPMTEEEARLAEKLEKMGFDGQSAYATLRYLNNEIGMWTVQEPFKQPGGSEKDVIAFNIITVHPLDNRPAYIDSVISKVWKDGDRTRMDISKKYDYRDYKEKEFPDKSQMIRDMRVLEKAQQVKQRFALDDKDQQQLSQGHQRSPRL